MKRSALSAIVAAGILLALAIPALSLQFGNGALRQFPDGYETRVGFDLAKAYDAYGGGTYVVQAFVFDADQLDDAASNSIQLSL
jgi:RND superfamily putative drug exporter